MPTQAKVPLNRKFWRLPAFPGDLGVPEERLLQDFLKLGIVAIAPVGHEDYDRVTLNGANLHRSY